MNLYLRLLFVLIKTLFCRRRDLLEPSRLSFRTMPLDCDINMHMNNGRYLTFMDLGRIHMLGQTGMLAPMIRARWMPVLGAANINFIRPIRPLRRFVLATRVVTWDDKYFYVEQRFESEGRLCAIGLVKGLFVSAGRRVESSAVLRKMQIEVAAPHMPDMVRSWNNLSEMKRKHYG